MSFNPVGAVGVPLGVYGSWCTELSPDSVPENISPDCQEVIFSPGDVSSRQGLQRVFATPFPGNPTVTYAKSFVTNTGDIKNLYLTSDGNLYVEDLSNSPGTYASILTTTPGSYARSVTFLGREFIAISDGLHGTEAPLQYDGTNLDRVTSDGPGAPAIIQNLALPPSQLTSGGNTLVRNSNTVTATTATDHGLNVGYQAQISGVPDSNSTTVNQLLNSTAQTVDGTYWSLSGSQYRSNFNPGSSPLAAFQASVNSFNIPSDATVLGIVVSLGAVAQSTTTGTIAGVSLYNSSGPIGTTKTPATVITTTPTDYSYGGAADQWGATLTPSIVNDPTFGFAVATITDSVRIFIDFPLTVQIYYTLSGTGTVAIISSILISNEVSPGLALVTTTQPSGLIPGIYVSIVGVEPSTVATVASAQWSSGTTTINTNANHNLQPGTVVQVAGVTTATMSTAFSFDGTFIVGTVPSPTQFTYEQAPITATDPDVINATAATGNVTISWPIPDNTPTPTYFEVESCPTPTTFYISLNYSDGMWTTGTVGFPWEGTFYVTQVISPTEFTYYQPGPNGATSAIGTVTPHGQAAPGLHLMQVLWLTRQGYIPAPSPPVTIIANGGQYLYVTNIPIGPAYVIGRILAFTGAQPDVPGELPPFFYIPTTPQLEGQIVGTSTQINDNTTTALTLDFSDNTLFAAIGISIPGNNLVNQIVLDGALGFGAYDGRLAAWGQRNTVQNLLNMGFGGGYSEFNPTQPLGWDRVEAGGNVGAGRFSDLSYSITMSLGNGKIQQSFYEDAYGDPIATADTLYAYRAYFFGTGTLVATISSSLIGFSATATLVATGPGFYEANFTGKTPLSIPIDILISLQGSSGTFAFNEGSLIYAENPYLDTISYASYEDNAEGMDGVSGKYGAVNDTHKLMDQAIIRDTLFLLTQDPSGRLHETTGSSVNEPSGWEVSEVASNCGTLSAFALTHSQADDTAASGGDDWMAWASEGGVMMFGGGQPEKISQEIQPNWNDPTSADESVQVNMSAAKTIWAVNDPVQRVLFFGLPIGSATAPDQIYPMNYRDLNSAGAIQSSPPFHPSFGGKIVATDNTRKWTHWLRPMNGAARMYRQAGKLSLVFFGGNGDYPNTATGFGNCYTLNPSLLTDDDYGQIFPYYTTYFFLDQEKAQALQLPLGRLMLSYQSMFVSAVGTLSSTIYCDTLDNPWPIVITRTPGPNPIFDVEMGGGYAQAQRMAFKIATTPLAGQTDNGFKLSQFVAWFKSSRLMVRGAAQ